MTLPAWCAAFVLGVAAALTLGFAPGRAAPAPAFWLIGAALALVTMGAGLPPDLVRSRKAAVRGPRDTAWLIAPLGLLFVAGAWLGGQALSDRDRLTPTGIPAAGRAVALEGALLEDPAPAADGSRLRLRIDAIDTGGTRYAARFEADVYARRLIAPAGVKRPVDGFQYGDRYRASGTFTPFPQPDGLLAGRLSARAVTLIGHSEGNLVRRAVAGLRQRLLSSIQRSIPGDAGGLAAAFVTGDRRGLSPELTAKFQEAGTAHLIAISGLNVTLVGMLALGAAAWVIGRRRQLYLAVPFATVWGYAVLAGLSPSVTRAAVMFSVYLAARALGRQRSALAAIGLAAAVMVALSPEALGSISFQLSFAAVAGIAVLGPGLTDWGRKLTMRAVRAPAPPAGVADAAIVAVATGIAATVATAPLFLFHFEAVAAWGVVATLLALPVMAVLIVSTAFAGLLGLAWPVAGQVIGWPAWITSQYTAELSRFFAWLPPGAVEAPWWTAGATAATYAALIAWLARRHVAAAMRSTWGNAENSVAAQPGWLKRRPPTWLTGLAFLLAALVWTGAMTSRSDGLLRVTFFETDQGDAIFIETPGRVQALVDGGRAAEGAVEAVDRRLPFWDRSLDLVLLTHSDQDHVGGLQAVLERYRVSVVADAPETAGPPTKVYETWLKLAQAHPRRVALTDGEVIALDDGVALEVISAGPTYEGAADNDSSVVTRLRYGDVSILLTADIQRAGEAALIRRGLGLESTVLQAPHHGSKSSSSEGFLAAVSPVAVVISAGSRNQFGHPHEEALNRIRAVVPDGRVFITKDRGDVTLLTDGRRLWVETAR